MFCKDILSCAFLIELSLNLFFAKTTKYHLVKAKKLLLYG